MKICNSNPAFGLVICDGARISCEPGGFVEVSDAQGKALMKQHKHIVEYGTTPPVPIEDEPEPAPVDDLLEPTQTSGKGRGRGKNAPKAPEPEPEPDAPDPEPEVDPLAALEEGTEE